MQLVLTVPTVSDRIAQTVVKLVFEPCVEPHFLPDSYGYRPNKSALDAIGITRQRCWHYSWLVEYDICGLFDNLDHHLLMKAVKKHTDNKWLILYIERWLKAPIQMPNGSLVERTKGVPQGSCITNGIRLSICYPWVNSARPLFYGLKRMPWIMPTRPNFLPYTCD